MVRKFAAALVALVIAVGAVFAEEIRGTFVKFADGKVTVNVDGKDKDYTVPADLKVKRKIKGEEREVSASKAFGRMKEGAKLVLTVEKDEVKDFKTGRKGK